MAAYIIVEVRIHDPEKYESYKQLTPASLQPYGGKFVVRGGEVETLEGDWLPERIIVVKFPTKEEARQWWDSEAYSQARVIRQEAAETKMILVEGLE